MSVRSAALTTALLATVPAHAFEGGLAACLLGSRDSLAGIAPPPGNYLTTDVIFIGGSVSF